MTYFIKKYFKIFEIVFLFLLSLIPLLWFKTGQIVIGLDSGYAVDYLKYFDQRIFTWFASHNFGVDFSAEVGVLPFNSGVPAVVSMLSVPMLDVQKFVFVFWFFLILISMYTFVNYVFPDISKWSVRISACIIYGLNLHLYSFWLQGEQTILSSYVILPLFTLFVLRFAQNKARVIDTAIYLNLVYLFFGSGGVRGVPLIGPVILTSITIFFYYFYIQFKDEGFSYLKRFIFLTFVFLPIFFLLEAYYIFPFLASFSHEFYNQVTIAGGIDGAIAWAKFISTHTSMLNIFRLHGDNNWYDKPFLWAWSYLTNPLLIIGGFLLPILAITAPIFSKSKKEKTIILFFALLLVVGMVMSTGAHEPFGIFYTYLMKFIPGFATFRSAWYKFMPTVIFSSAILIGFSIYYLSNRWKPKYGWIFSTSAIFILLAYHYVYFTSDNFVYNKPFSTMVKIPQYVYEFSDYQKSRTDDYRTLVVPHSNLGFTIKAFDWGYYGAYPIYPLITDNGFVLYDSYLFNDSENALVASLYQNLREGDFESFKKGAEISHIKYILVAKDVAHDYNFAPTELPGYYEKILADDQHFKTVWSAGKWRIYEIQNFDESPKIDSLNTLASDNSDYSSIDSLFSISDSSFVFRDQVDHEVYNKLPINSVFNQLTCVTCTLNSQVDKPSIQFSRINPGSLLYSHKLSKDNALLHRNVTPDDLLGLSLKRVGEIVAVKEVIKEPRSSRESIDALESAITYWNKLRSIVESENTNYALMQKVSKYLDLEIEQLGDIYTVGYTRDNPNLHAVLVELLSDLKKTKQITDNIISENDWDATFIYDVVRGNEVTRDIYVNVNSLPRNSENNPIYPIQYQEDNDSVKEVMASGNKLLALKENTRNLKLIFDELPNLAQLESRSLELLDKNESCLYTHIPNYLWNKKYQISTVTKNTSLSKSIYIKREYNLLKTQEFNPMNTDYFNPDLIFLPSKTTGQSNTYQFTGQPNDRGAEIYFCTDIGEDPKEVFDSIKINEIVEPKVFTYQSSIINNIALPSVNFKKINPSHYVAIVKGARDPYILNFKEAYSPNWQASVNNIKIDNHFRINGYANSWLINKKGDYEVEIKFYTQSMFYKGLKITIVTLVVILAYMLVKAFRNKYGKHK